MHALLFRRWKNRVKGRDWYDLEWYIKQQIPLDVGHFLCRAKDSGDWQQASISPAQILTLLHEKIDTANFEHIKDDVIRFIKDASILTIWSRRYFHDLAEKLKFNPHIPG